MKLTRRAALIAATTTLTLGMAASASTASANDDDVIRQGSCSGSTDWKLKASPEDGRIEVEGEIDSNHVGQTWNWRLLHNGATSSRGTKVTKAPSGSFEVRRLMVNAAGKDAIELRGKNVRSGETCKGTLRF
jgi:hypothetical protein